MTAILLFCACLLPCARSWAQTVTYSGKNVPLERIFDTVSKQTGYYFFFQTEQLADAKPVTIHANKVELESFLKEVFKNQPLKYSIRNKSVTVSRLSPAGAEAPALPSRESLPGIRGRVMDPSGAPLSGASVRVKGSNRGVETNVQGEFFLKDVSPGTELKISFTGYQEKTVVAVSQRFHTILQVSNSPLDAVQIIAYGTTTKRLSTGNVTTVKASEIEKQPVTNPLAALQGRVPGLVITQTNGVPGSAYKVQIRGINSLTNGTDPLFIIDGVPFAPGNGFVNNEGSAATATEPGVLLQTTSSGVNGLSVGGNGGISPFNSINPADIESIDVLKDADATAIYGSRGANGVVLITTKRGKAGVTAFNVNAWTGISQVARKVPMMNTKQYLAMRREAFKNDGIVPNITNAPDLVAWDTTRYIDWQKLLTGGTAVSSDMSATVSGGNINTQFLLGGGYHRETTVFPSKEGQNRGSFNLSLNHKSSDKRFSADLSLNYTSSANNLPMSIGALNLPPNAPRPVDNNDNLNWAEGGVSFENPLAGSRQKYRFTSDNLLSSLLLEYKITRNLAFKSSFGFNSITVKEDFQIPVSSQNPYSKYTVTGSNASDIRIMKILNLEPRLEYKGTIGDGKLTVLFGGALQKNTDQLNYAHGSDYTNDALLGTIAAAPTISFNNSVGMYKYAALFGRISYNWKDKYLVNLSGRRDGSSRFGPGRQYNNFGAVGAAWLFSNELFIRKAIPFFSSGKLRGSWGVTGNDQIGDYQYLDTWSIAGWRGYNGGMGLTPDALFNPNFNWERNRETDIGLELGWWKDRLTMGVSWHRNVCDNQLVAYIMPSQTGFKGMIRNFPATIRNQGWELEIAGDVISTRNWKWNLSANLTIPRNRLTRFPGIDNSSYANFFVVGESLTVLRKWRFQGIDSATGLYKADQFDKFGNIDIRIKDPNFYTVGDLDPKYYGGFRSQLSYKGLECTLFVEFKKQLGRNILYTPFWNNQYPGLMYNQPVYFLDRWQKAGDRSAYGKFTASTTSPAFKSEKYLAQYADLVYSDASWIRLRNVSISYTLPGKWVALAGLKSFRTYLQGQNLLLFTPMKGIDPESPNYITTIPPLRTITAGIQMNF